MTLAHLRRKSPGTTKLRMLEMRVHFARQRYFQHLNPGGLTPAELTAFEFEHEAYELLLMAAHTRLNAEQEMLALLEAEQEAVE